jgi:dihydroflavonol-4-reductase
MVTGERVLITGGTGFVGSAVARAASARGFGVRVLVRPESPRTNLAGFPNEIAEGDMRDEASVLRALEGVRYLFHVAADYRIWAHDPGEIIRNNREGTRAVMAAAKTSGVEKIVYTSSVATLRPVEGSAAGEASRLDQENAIGAYKTSKLVAEQLV